jgi:choline dehydrogenase-like flavoprotein
VPDDALQDQLRELAAGREYMREYVAERKPYWLNLRQPWDDELQWELNNYAPLAYYDRAIATVQAAEDEDEDGIEEDVAPDGGYGDLHNGPRTSTVFYWLDPDTDAVLTHTGLGDDAGVPFYPDIGAAERELEHRADREGEDQYAGLSLYRAKTRKVKDAVDVLTDQSGIEDFLHEG